MHRLSNIRVLSDRLLATSVSKSIIPRNGNCTTYSTVSSESKLTPVEEEFRQLQLRKQREPRKPREKLKVAMSPPRYTKMPVDQEWSDVWPTAQSFKPSVVPLPVRQGYTEKNAPPGKFGNLELMKIPNFLHLTPPAIKKHCAAIKKFCTPWPKELDSDEKCEEHFPVEIISSDYCHSGPDLRDPRSRIVCLKIKLHRFNLNERAKDKILRLVGDRYDQKTDIITLTAESCPLKKQNYDYVHYILTALYHESLKIEPWESEKTRDDMERYIWEESSSHNTLCDTIKMYANAEKKPEWIQSWVSKYPPDWVSSFKKEDVMNVSEVRNYSDAVTQLHDKGESEEMVNFYKVAVKKLFGFRDLEKNQ